MTYDIVQTVFALSMASNGVSNLNATEAELNAYLKSYLMGGPGPKGTHLPGILSSLNQNLAGGDWDVVWGPCVYLKGASGNPAMTGYATNALYVAHSPSLNTYVVAVAATNERSFFDWVIEDGDVDMLNTARWPITLPFKGALHLALGEATPQISGGAATGISDLLTEAAMRSNGQFLPEFLKSLTQLPSTANSIASQSTLIFAGHSLAGALTPCMALHLYPEPSDKAPWANIHVLPTAGATFGNGGVAAQFNRTFPPTPVPGITAPYGHWNMDVTNKHDVVPHAWNYLGEVVQAQNGDGTYPSIYGVLNDELGTLVKGALDVAEKLSSGVGYTPIAKLWYEGDLEPVHTVNNPATVADFGTLVLNAHIANYFTYFNVTPLVSLQDDEEHLVKTPTAQPIHQSLLKIIAHVF